MPTVIAQRGRLSNGLGLVHEYNPVYPVVAFHLWVNVGSAYETDETAGAFHFLEHMLFKGTDRRDAFTLNAEIEDLGGQMNAFTTYEQTAYHLVLSSRYWRQGLDVLLDMVFHSQLDEEEADVERDVILEEIREGNDSLDTFFGERFFERLYPGHGYGRPVIGSEASVKGLTRRALWDHYRRWYTPKNMVLAVAGNVEWGPLFEAVKEFAGEQNLGEARPSELQETTEPASAPYLAVNRGSEERILEVAFPIPHLHHKDIPTLDVLSVLLGHGDTSRLYREFRLNREWARSVDASLFVPFRQGRFLIHALPDKGQTLPILRELHRQVALLRNRKIPSIELERAKQTLDKELIFNDETAEGRAKTLAYYEMVFGSYEEEAKYRQRIFAVTEGDLRDAVEHYLVPEKAAVGLLLPQGEAAPAEGEIEAIRRPSRVASGKVSATRGGGSVDTYRFTVSNGMRVVVRRVTGGQFVSLQCAATGGLFGETKETNGISNLIAATVDRGTRSRSDERIADEITLLKAHLSGFSGQNSDGLRMDVVRENFPEATDLFLDVLGFPEFDAEVVEQERRVILRDLDTQKDYFDVMASNLFMEALFPGHPYGLHNLGTPESLGRLASAELKRHYRALMRPERMVLAAVGDIDPDKFLSELENAWTDGAGEAGPKLSVPPPTPLTGLREILRPIQGEKAYLQFGFRGTTLASTDRYAVEILAMILAGSSGGRLFLRLREELGLVYSIDAGVMHGIDTGAISIQWNTAPDRADQSLEEVNREIQRISTDEIPQEELERVKHFLSGSYEIDLQRTGPQASQLCLGELFGIEKELRDYVNGISRVTAHEVLEAAQKYLTPASAVKVILSPRVH